MDLNSILSKLGCKCGHSDFYSTGILVATIEPCLLITFKGCIEYFVERHCEYTLVANISQLPKFLLQMSKNHPFDDQNVVALSPISLF
jgi:hypothetical protein